MGNPKLLAYCLGCRARVEVAEPVMVRCGVVAGGARWVSYRARCGVCGGGLSGIRQERVERACPPHHFMISQDGREGWCKYCGETRDYADIREKARHRIAEVAKKRGIGMQGDLYP